MTFKKLGFSYGLSFLFCCLGLFSMITSFSGAFFLNRSTALMISCLISVVITFFILMRVVVAYNQKGKIFSPFLMILLGSFLGAFPPFTIILYPFIISFEVNSFFERKYKQLSNNKDFDVIKESDAKIAKRVFLMGFILFLLAVFLGFVCDCIR